MKTPAWRDMYKDETLYEVRLGVYMIICVHFTIIFWNFYICQEVVLNAKADMIYVQ